jgi:hypothetical protein
LLTNSDYSVTVPHLGSIDFDYFIVLIPILHRIHISKDPLAFDDFVVVGHFKAFAWGQ